MKRYPMFTEAVLLLAVTALMVFPAAGCKPKESSASGDSGAAAAVQKRLYEVVNTVEYDGGEGKSYAQCADGLIVMATQPAAAGQLSYHAAFSGEVISHEDGAAGEMDFPAVGFRRDPASQKFVGGDNVLISPAAVANAAVRQISARQPADGEAQTVLTEFDLGSEYPEQLAYRLETVKQHLPGVGPVIVSSAVGPVEFNYPGHRAPIRGTHRVLTVMDAEMQELLFYCSSFYAAADGSDGGDNLRIETLIYAIEDGKPMRLDGLQSPAFEDFRNRLDLSRQPLKVRSNVKMPDWAYHALAVRDMTDIVAGVAIERKTNPVVTLSLAAVLFADSLLSLGTAAAQRAGYIEKSWPGIPNYVGGKIGLAGAKVYEKASGSDVDEKAWSEAGGLAGDVVAILNPGGVLNVKKKIDVGAAGARIVSRAPGAARLSSAAHRIAQHGDKVIKTGRTIASSETLQRRLATVSNVLHKATDLAAAESISGRGAAMYNRGSSDQQADGRTVVNAGLQPGPEAGMCVVPPKATDPKQALINYLTAFQTGDADLFHQSAAIDAPMRETADSIFAVVSAATRFRLAFVAAYKQEFSDLAGLGAMAPADVVRTQGKVELRGDSAQLTLPNGGRFPLVRRDGVWKVNMAEQLTQMGFRRLKSHEKMMVAKQFAAYAAAYNEVRPRIGQSGYDARKIVQELQAAAARRLKEAGVAGRQ